VAWLIPFAAVILALSVADRLRSGKSGLAEREQA
jgi:hypothetical protein